MREVNDVSLLSWWHSLFIQPAPHCEPSEFDRYIDPEIVHAPESSPKQLEKLRAEMRERRSAAVTRFGEL
jgi:hypothetical protein